MPNYLRQDFRGVFDKSALQHCNCIGKEHCEIALGGENGV